MLHGDVQDVSRRFVLENHGRIQHIARLANECVLKVQAPGDMCKRSFLLLVTIIGGAENFYHTRAPTVHAIHL
jgi:hypothetical protein